MFFSRRREEPPSQGWQELAARLDLVPAPEQRELLLDLLDLPPDFALEPIYKVAEAGAATVSVFAHESPVPTPAVRSTVSTSCLLVSPEALSPVSWRASRRVHDVLSSLQASRSGGQIVAVPEDASFTEQVTVVAREAEHVAGLLTPVVRSVLARSLTREGLQAEVTVGEGRLLLSHSGAEVAFAAVPAMLTDILSLFAALRSLRQG